VLIPNSEFWGGLKQYTANKSTEPKQLSAESKMVKDMGSGFELSVLKTGILIRRLRSRITWGSTTPGITKKNSHRFLTGEKKRDNFTV
jgi:hypothetical protein